MKIIHTTAVLIIFLLLFGTMALYGGSEDDGNRNVYYGLEAGHSLTTENNDNLFIGYFTGYNTEEDGNSNVYLGKYSGYFNTTGYQNTFTGVNSGYSNTTGKHNTFTGINSGWYNSSGDENTFVGQQSGYHNTTGYYNTFTGAYSGYKNTTGYHNTFTGRESGYSNTTGEENTFTGTWSGNSSTGNSNTFTGKGSGYENTTGYNNTFSGAWSGKRNKDGDNNTFYGAESGFNISGKYNTFIGTKNATYSNNSGSYNTFTGKESGYYNSSGSYNTFTGKESGYQNTTGSRNTFLGYLSIGTEDINNSISIGYRAGYHHVSRDNTLYIANSRTYTPLIYGEFDTELLKINGELNTTNTVTTSVTEDSTANTKTLFRLMRNNTNTSYESDVSFVLENVQKSFQWTFRTLASEKGFSISKVGSGKKEMILTGNDHSDGIQILMGDGGKYFGGQWLVASSRAYKENIKEIDTHTALEAFHQLKPVHFNYKTDKKEGVIGFIAEDVPSIVATKKRDSLSAMEILTLLIKVAQGEEEKLKKKEIELKAMKEKQKAQNKKIAIQNEKIAQIELLLGTLTGKRLDKKEKPLSFKMK